jgi:hypothetical protein
MRASESGQGGSGIGARGFQNGPPRARSVGGAPPSAHFAGAAIRLFHVGISSSFFQRMRSFCARINVCYKATGSRRVTVKVKLQDGITVRQASVDFGNSLSRETHFSRLLTTVLLALSILIVSCKGGTVANGSNNPSSDSPLTAPWSFHFTSSSPTSSTDSVTVDANLIQPSDQFQSAAIQVGQACIRPSFSSENITGSLTGGNVSSNCGLRWGDDGLDRHVSGRRKQHDRKLHDERRVRQRCGNVDGS